MLQRCIYHHTGLWSRMSLFIILILLAGCRSRDPIRIGFAGELTGLRSGLGVDGRDGAQLAVDVINERGGIRGRSLELIVKNDKGDPEGARQVDAELIEAGVVGIIGHMTSGQSAAVIDQMNDSGVVLVSPTSSSDQFTGIEDNFFRVMPTTNIHGRALANHMANFHQYENIAGVYDLANRAFAETLWFVIHDELQRLGVDMLSTYNFTSEQTDLKALAAEIVAGEPDAVVFVSSDVDTALLAQHIRQQGSDVPLFSSGWALTSELLAKGGSAVEGLEIVALYNLDNEYPKFQEFRERFVERYNRLPGFGSAYAYEAVLLLVEGLKEGNEDLSHALTEVQMIEGVQGTIIVDKFGDVNRTVFIAVIEDGEYKIIEKASFQE